MSQAAEDPSAHRVFSHDVAQVQAYGDLQCLMLLYFNDQGLVFTKCLRCWTLSVCVMCMYLYIISADIYFASPVANDNTQKDLSLTNIKSNMCPICIKLAG